MQKMMKVLWLAFASVIGLSNLQGARAEQWVLARDLKNPPYLIDQTGEKALLYKSGDRAGGALVVFGDGYPEVLAALIQKVETTDGIAARLELPKSSFLNMFDPVARGVASDDVRALWFHSWKADLARMNQAGLVTDGFHEARIESKSFNQLPNRGAYSVASFHVLDATELFGVSGTVVIVYRHDRAKEWGWHNAHDPFSFGYKLRVERQYTSHEQEIIDGVAKMVRSPFTVIPIGANSLTSYVDEWMQARAWITARPPSAARKTTK